MLKETIKLVIPGTPIVKKNTKKLSMFRYDKRTNRKIPLEKPVTYYSSAYTDWAKTAIMKCVLLKQSLENNGVALPIQEQMNLKCLFFFDKHIVVDLSNLYEAPQDLLAGNAGVYKDSVPKKLYQIIEDDSVRFICSHDGSRFLFDHINPRTEIYLEPFVM